MSGVAARSTTANWLGGERPPPRMVIERVAPEIDAGRHPIKRIAGEPVELTASIFTEGHDRVAAALRFRRAGDSPWSETPMTPLGNDRFGASFVADELGRFEYTIVAWVDTFASWRSGLERKVAARQDVSLELREGASLVRAAAARADADVADRLSRYAERLSAAEPLEERVALALAPALLDTMERHPDRSEECRYDRVLELVVECERAGVGAWYEFFPRSSGPKSAHGSFADARARLRHAAGMGFDVVYLPPIHPIGTTHRKGRNNSALAEPGDPGSPWAIGAPDGGHTAVHPELGTLEDFDAFVADARAQGLDVALDVAFQCSPDHPWVREHPQWFRRRPDGSIQYAENPPKRYQDVLPLDFESADWRALWQALLDVFLFWAARGVRIFRVDNPHTKPFAFWEWAIDRLRERHPDAVFLSEAFTRPSVMKRLAKLGFSQSYTYFTWRNTKSELTAYLEDLLQGECREYMRPNFFANTPDINPEFLQVGGRAAFQIRLVLAATLAGSYGIYGPVYELAVSDALPGSEEYLDSEKFEIRHWDLAAPGNLIGFVRRVNEIRREHRALRRGTLRFVPVDHDEILAYLRRDPGGEESVLVVVALTPHRVVEGWVELPLEELGLDPARSYQMHDLLGGARYLWNGRRGWVSLDPAAAPAHVFRIRRHVRSEREFDYYL